MVGSCVAWRESLELFAFGTIVALIARRAVRGYDITNPICRRQAQVAPKNSASVYAVTILDSNHTPLRILEGKREG